MAVTDYVSQLVDSIDDLVRRELSHLHTSQCPTLEIEATLHNRQNNTLNVSPRMHLITIDINRWHLDRKEVTPERAKTQNSHENFHIHHDSESSASTVAEESSNTTHSTQTIESPALEGREFSKDKSAAHQQVELQSTDKKFDTESRSSKRRRTAGSALRPQVSSQAQVMLPLTPRKSISARQLSSNDNIVPQRRKPNQDQIRAFRPLTLDKLIHGIWDNLHGSDQFKLPPAFPELQEQLHDGGKVAEYNNGSFDSFRTISSICQRVSRTARSFRALEVIVQAHWVECFDARVAVLNEENRTAKSASIKQAALREACRDLAWSEKELRNRMAVWRGYSELKNAAGWPTIIFASAGLYRFCKYRVAFDPASLSKLARLRSRFEVAADTLQPGWRDLSAVIGRHCRRVYRGHAHDWTVSNNGDPIPLAWTYRQQDPNFTFKHIEVSVIDEKAWETFDPRRIQVEGPYICNLCQHTQSQDHEKNECECFPDLSSNYRPYPVQIFRTEDGRNNGLLACCEFERGTMIAEFVGIITKGLMKGDVFSSQAGQNLPYQISQAREGNYSRFINHSCLPNCQFQSFNWLGLERILIVSKGVSVGAEITVDYSGRYWQGFDKECRCGQACCQYKQGATRSR